MNQAAQLERWYRRLLTWYPAEHRRAYGEEMIGVLLASTPRGRRRPNVANVLDLVKGGLLVRLRPPASSGTDAGWRDTLAVFSIAAPVLVLLYYLVSSAARLTYLSRISGSLNPVAMGTLVVVLAITGPALLGLRARRTAATLAGAMAIFYAVLAIPASQFAYATSGWYPVFFALEMVALAISPGPRRGVALMTWPAWILVAGAGSLAGLTRLPFALGYYGSGVLVTILTAAALTLVAGLVLALQAPVGARLLLLLAIPGYPAMMAIYGIGEIVSLRTTMQFSLVLIYLPVLALACLVTALAVRSRKRAAG